METSPWMESSLLPTFPKLKGERKTEVLIIGGGICGLMIAYKLKGIGIDCTLVEANTIASGITKNTTAKITASHGLIYDDLIKTYGVEKAKMYLDANLNAVKEYAKMCSDIDCDFETRNSYIYSTTDIKQIDREMHALDTLGYKAGFSPTIEVPVKVQGAIEFKNQAQFNPIKFIQAISKEIRIYENTMIRDITPDAAICEDGKIHAKKIIVATHFPFINKHGGYFLKLYQHRSYVAAYTNARTIQGMYADCALKGMSFRPYRDMLLIGGGGHRTGKKGGSWHEIDQFVQQHYPDAKLEYRWASQDCMSLDGIPYIGNYSPRTPNLYVATGFNKWGFSSSMVAANILSDMVLEKDNPYSAVFHPNRSMLKPQLFVNGFEATVNLLTPTLKRCPHLGCALKWNKAEHSWDCPCHGSRFDSSGKLIDNPATGDAKM